MPTIPNKVSLNASSIDILNTIRNYASSTYQERIPIATQENLKELGHAMMTYQATQNEFLEALVNRIALVIIQSRSYENPLRRFKKGVLEYGEAIEEVFVNIAKAHQYDPAIAEKEVFKREIPDVNAVFHHTNYKNFWKQTISNEQLRSAFLSPNGVSDLIAKIVDAMYTAEQFDEFLIMKNLVVEAAQAGKLYPVNVPEVNADNAKAIVTKIKGISNALEFMSPQYNPMGVLTYTPKSDQVLLLDAQFDATIDVEVLASAFNMDKAEFMGQRVLIDNFGQLTGVVAALVDSRWFMVFDKWRGFTEIYNNEGLYWNYTYHAWKIFSTSPFANAILFTTQPIVVTSVTVTPATANVTRGQQLQLTAAVVGTGYVPSDIKWSVNSEISTINDNGLLTVPTSETATTLTVTATSVYDNTKSGTATITLS